MALNEADLLFAAKREPVVKWAVIDVADDIFAKGFTVEEVAEKPDPAWSRGQPGFGWVEGEGCFD